MIKSIRHTCMCFNNTLVSTFAIKFCCGTSKGQISRHLGSHAGPCSLSLVMRSLLTRHSHNTAVTAIKLVIIRIDNKKKKVIFNNLNYLFFSFTRYRRYLQFQQWLNFLPQVLALTWQNNDKLLIEELPLSSF